MIITVPKFDVGVEKIQNKATDFVCEFFKPLYHKSTNIQVI